MTEAVPERSWKHRILWNERGRNIDEIVIDHPTSVHVEQLDGRCWWIGIYLSETGTGEEVRRWSGYFTADSCGRMKFSEQDNDIEWDLDEEHERTGSDG